MFGLGETQKKLLFAFSIAYLTMTRDSKWKIGMEKGFHPFININISYSNEVSQFLFLHIHIKCLISLSVTFPLCPHEIQLFIIIKLSSPHSPSNNFPLVGN